MCAVHHLYYGAYGSCRQFQPTADQSSRCQKRVFQRNIHKRHHCCRAAYQGLHFLNSHKENPMKKHIQLQRLRHHLAIGACCLFGAMSAHAVPSDNDCFFDWAESQLPKIFSPAHQPTQSFPGVISFRTYPASGTALGVMDMNVLVAGGQFGNLPLNAGGLRDYLPLARASNCASTTTPTPAAVSFQVAGRFLQDSAGTKINFRGVNVGVFKSGYVDDLQRVAQAIHGTGANSVRLVWWGNTANGWSNPADAPNLLTLSNLDRAITEYASLGILPILELHDATRYLAVGMNTPATWNDPAVFKARITDFWTHVDVMALIKKHQSHLVANLANEWGAVSGNYADAPAFVQNYTSAIASIRSTWAAAGIGNIPLMVDAPNGGTNVNVFLVPNADQPKFTNGQVILNADPLKNTLLSTHTYWPESEGYTSARITGLMADIERSGLPIVLGEVGTNANGSSCNADVVDWNTVMTEAVARNIGMLAWTWYEEGNCNDMNIAPDGSTLPANDGAMTFRNQVLRNANYGLNRAIRFSVP
ncbi:MAG: hypothetical protein CFE44_08870 [Burkholderiales bacterium PBB4]|nr:MAG: hypothetical protein CFE44_08870 [Burkholderiales bacterium PBB4]